MVCSFAFLSTCCKWLDGGVGFVTTFPPPIPGCLSLPMGWGRLCAFQNALSAREGAEVHGGEWEDLKVNVAGGSSIILRGEVLEEVEEFAGRGGVGM